MNLLKNNWCVRYTGKEDKLIQWLNNFKGASIHDIDNGKYYYGVKYKKPNYKFLPNLSLEPWDKILTYEQFLKHSNMDNNELTIKKDRVLEVAETCPDSKPVLSKLFPEVFKEDKLDEKVKVGDIFCDEDGDYSFVINCTHDKEIVNIRSCNRVINCIDLYNLTRNMLIEQAPRTISEYVGNVYEDNIIANLKLHHK